MGLKSAIKQERNNEFYRSILWRSVKDFLFYPKSRRHYKTAYEWLYETSLREPTISFKEVCKKLHLDQDKIIFLLHDYKDQKKRNVEGVEWDKFLEMCEEE